MKAIILCGGKGTRLGKLTEGKQKCMLDVDNGTPFLHFVVENVRQNLTNDIVLCINEHDREIQKYFGNNVWYSKDSDNETQMDAIFRVLVKQDGNCVVLNGDTFFSPFPCSESLSWANRKVIYKISHNLCQDAGIYTIKQTSFNEAPGIKTIDEFLGFTNVILGNFNFFVDIGTPKGLQYAKDNIGVIKNALYKA